MARYYRSWEAADILLINTTALRSRSQQGLIFNFKVDGMRFYPADYLDALADRLEELALSDWRVPYDDRLKMTAHLRQSPPVYLEEWRKAVESVIRRGRGKTLYIPVAEARALFGTIRSNDIEELDGERMVALTANWPERAQLSQSPAPDWSNSWESAPSNIHAPREERDQTDSSMKEDESDHDLENERRVYAAAKAWAKQRGINVPPRGRVSKKLLLQYQTAQVS